MSSIVSGLSLVTPHPCERLFMNRRFANEGEYHRVF